MATDLERLVVQLSADVKSYERSMQRAVGVTNRQMATIERRAKSMGRSLDGVGRDAARSLIAPLTGLGAALGVAEIARYADAWTEAGNKIRSAATSSGVQARSLDDLKEGANGARTSLEAYVDLYARLIRSASGVAKSENEIALATDIVSKAFKAGGASAQEQASGILQLGQALGSGVLQGDELRSLRENAPIIAKAIADEFGVAVAGLKKLGAEGKLTSDRVFKALINAQSNVEAQFKATNATIKDAITQVNNEFTAYIGNADASAGASRSLVAALQFLASNFTDVGNAVVTFSTLIIGALTGRAIVGMVAGVGNAVVALGAFLSALRAGTVVAGTFTAALGPIGLLAGAAAAAIFLLATRSDEGDQAAQAHKAAMLELKDAFTKAQGGAKGAGDELLRLSKLHVQNAEAALKDAEAHVAAAQAMADANAAMPGIPFEEQQMSRGIGNPGFAAEELKQRLADLDKAKSKLKEIKDFLADPAGTIVKDNPGFGGGIDAGDGSGKKGKKNAFERELAQIKERTSAIQAETAAQAGLNPLVNDYGFAVNKASAAHSLLAAAQEAGIKITPELTAQIDHLATGFATASADADRLVESQDRIRQTADEFKSLGQDALKGFITDLKDGKSGAEALAGALDKIADKLLDLSLNSLFDSKSGGLGGLLNGFLGGGGSKGFASGGYTGNGGKYQPKGVVHGGEYVFSKEAVQKAGAGNLDAMHKRLKGFASGGAVTPTMPTIPRLSGFGQQRPQVVVKPVNSFGPQAESVTSVGSDGSIEVMFRRLKADIARDMTRGQGDIGRAALATGSRPVLRG